MFFKRSNKTKEEVGNEEDFIKETREELDRLLKKREAFRLLDYRFTFTFLFWLFVYLLLERKNTDFFGRQK